MSDRDPYRPKPELYYTYRPHWTRIVLAVALTLLLTAAGCWALLGL